MSRIFLCLLFITFSFLNGFGQNKIDFDQLKKWKLLGYGGKIKRSDFNINTTGIDTEWKAIAYHKFETNLKSNSSYSIKCNFLPCQNLEIGLAFFKVNEESKKKDLYFFNSFPSFQNSNSKTDFKSNGTFISIGNENVIVLYVRNSDSKKTEQTESFTLKTLEFVKNTDKNSTENLIENGDFEHFHALFRGTFCLQLAGLSPPWNLSSSYTFQLSENQILISLESHPFEGYMKFSEYSTFRLGSPDIYYSTEKDSAASGHFYVGMNILGDLYGEHNRGCEYLQIKLKRKLHEDEKIRVSFYYKIDEKYTPSNGLGIAFTDSIIQKKPSAYPSEIIYKTGQANNEILDSHEWCYIEFNYFANGNEEFLTIGDFQNSELKLSNNKKRFLSYYLIDDIKVESISVE